MVTLDCKVSGVKMTAGEENIRNALQYLCAIMPMKSTLVQCLDTTLH